MGELRSVLKIAMRTLCGCLQHFSNVQILQGLIFFPIDPSNPYPS